MKEAIRESALRIRRCTLRVRRRGGWSWGRDPRRLVETTVGALPELIGDGISRSLDFTGEGDLVIPRLTLRLPATLTELAALADPGDLLAREVLVERVRARVHAEVGPTSLLDAPAPREPPALPMAEPIAAPPGARMRDTPSLLRAWYAKGWLLPILRCFSEKAIADWEALVLQSLLRSNHKRAVADPSLDVGGLVERVAAALPAGLRVGERRIFLMAALLACFPDLTAVEIAKLLDARFGALVAPAKASQAHGSVEGPESAVLPGASEVLRAAPRERARAAEREARRPLPLAGFERKVSSVLPFVALGVLARLDYLQVLATALRAAGLEEEGHAFGQALALKMLAPARRGWHRDEADLRTAAAAAGLVDPFSRRELERFAGGFTDAGTAVDALVRRLVIEGHDPSWAWAVHATQDAFGPCWTVVDTQGSFVAGWPSDRDSLLRLLEDCGGGMLLMSEPTRDPALLAELSARGGRFVTSLAPGRRDRWRPVDPRRRFWTNDQDASLRWLARQIRRLGPAVAAADAASRGLLVERTILPPDGPESCARAFEHSVALAAASALAMIAWQLWGKDEETNAMLALERLGSLEGMVRVEGARITVRPSLGRRFIDLRAAGLLRDVPDVPWFQGRKLEFAGP